MAPTGTLLWNSYLFEFMADGEVMLSWQSGASTTISAETTWGNFKLSQTFITSNFYTDFNSQTNAHRVYGSSGADTISRATGGGVYSGGGNDTINVSATTGTSQIHVYAGAGNDVISMSFANIAGAYSHGHHSLADDYASGNYGADSFNFQSSTSVGAGETVVGRLEDFDPTRDTIRIDGTVLNLSSLPSNVKIIHHNGDHNDAGAPTQQWLVIKTSTGGFILYALEGARIDMTGNGGANGGTQESHFLFGDRVSANAIINLYNTQPGAEYVNPFDFVPAGATAQGGQIISDGDETAADVLAPISGTVNGDLIAAGLNNDVVNAGAGNDQLWGGSGHDTVNGDAGNDSLMGNLGNDVVNGGDGDDLVTYHGGTDTVNGGAGTDTLVFAGSGAMVVNLEAGTNGHGMVISGIENLTGAAGTDNLSGDAASNTLTGNGGIDTLDGRNGNDLLYGGSADDMLYGNNGNDTILGGADNDRLLGQAGVDSLTGGLGDDLFRYQFASQGGDIITDFDSVAGNNDRFSIDASGFGGGLVGGSLSASQFRLNLNDSNAATLATHRFIYNTVANTLWFDVDGTGAAAAVLIATLQSNAPDVTAGDIWLFA